MVSLIFAILCFPLLLLQSLLQIHIFHFLFVISFETIFIVYLGFEFKKRYSLPVVILLALIAESLGGFIHGSLILSHLALFFLVRLLVQRMYAEAYVTKAFLIFWFYILHFVFQYFIRGSHLMGLLDQDLWLGLLISSVVTAIVSVGVFIFLDWVFNYSIRFFGKPLAEITGAEIFQAKKRTKK